MRVSSFEQNPERQLEEISLNKNSLIRLRRRREEGIPNLISKCENAIKQRFDNETEENLIGLVHDQSRCRKIQVNDFLQDWQKAT